MGSIFNTKWNQLIKDGANPIVVDFLDPNEEDPQYALVCLWEAARALSSRWKLTMHQTFWANVKLSFLATVFTQIF